MAFVTSTLLSSPNSIPQRKSTGNSATKSSPFHPSVWRDYFMSYSEDRKKIEAWTNTIERLKEEVKRMLSKAKGSIDEMIMIDEIQRLGVTHHFEKEIDGALEQIYDANVDYDDLHIVALRFRLLRHEGYNVSSDVFSKFKGNKGTFDADLTGNVRGLLSLYEAAFYGTREEDILDEAISFTKENLSSLVTCGLNGPLVVQVAHALELPMRKRIPRLEARFYISIFQEEKKHNDALLNLAKLDFNLLQLLHQLELKELTKWWKNIGLATKYPFARDRLVEGYLWVLGVYHEPKYARGRSIFIRMFKLISIFDDIFDVDGTFEDLKLFTDAIERWDLKAIDQIPEYMRPCYFALLNTVEEIEDELMSGEKFYRTEYLKHATKTLIRGYFKEAQWLKNGHVPTLEEYLKVALVTGGYLYLTGVAYVGMGEEATKEAFDWLKRQPKFVMDSTLVCRLTNDIVNELEQQRNHIPSSVECYMKEHGVSREEACNKIRDMVALAWKDINKFCLRPIAFPMSLLMRVINLTQVVEVLYLNGDGYTHSLGETKEKITAILINPLPM